MIKLTPIQACQYYIGSFWLLPVQFNAMLPPPTLNTTAITALLKQVSVATGAEVVSKGMSFEMYGLEQEVRAAVNMIMEVDIIKVCLILTSHSPSLILYPDLPPRDSIPDRVVQRAPRVHQWEEERKNQQDHANYQCQNQV